jgi:hypothetical protein
MSYQNGKVRHGAGDQRDRASNPAIAPLAKARRRIQKPPESNRACVHLAKVLKAPVSESAWPANEQIRQGEFQQHGAQVASESAFGQMAVTHLEPNVQAKRKRRTSNQRLSPPFAGALEGLVPAVPIFIPADQICRERSLRDLKSQKEERSSGSTATVLLTAELLTRRWVQGNDS